MNTFSVEEAISGEIMKTADPTQLYFFFDRLFRNLRDRLLEKIYCDSMVPARAEFIMNRLLYKQFLKSWPAILPPEWNGIHIREIWDDPDFCEPIGKITLTYNIPTMDFELKERNRAMPPKGASEWSIKECFFAIPKDLKIEKVIFNDPATIVMWNDGTKTVVKCQENDTFDHEKGLAMCIAKRFIGLKDFYKAFNPAFDKWLENLTVSEESIFERWNKAIEGIKK